MLRFIRNLAFAVFPLFAPSALASSCDAAQPPGVDVQMVNNEESQCAKKALADTDIFVREANASEQRSEMEGMCNSLYSSLVLLDKYRAGDWRAKYKSIAGKIDEGYAANLDRFLLTSCRKKTELYRYLAERGNAWGMFNMAVSYSKGVVLAQDDNEALAWYLKAAEKQYTPAYLALGTMFSDGLAFREDFVVAFEWFNKAAEAGDAGAQFNVASMYRNGVGVKQDFLKAAEWYGKAAEQKHPGAQAKLEEMYQAGQAKKPGRKW